MTSKTKLRKMLTELIATIDTTEPLWSLPTSPEYKLMKAHEELAYAIQGFESVERIERAIQLLVVYLDEKIHPQAKRRSRSKDPSGSSVDDGA